MTPAVGAAGRLALAFIHSKLTPLVIVASLLLGAFAVIALPREEEPQILVPMVDVFVDLPGASPAEIEQRVTRPVEQWLWEIPGVEYVYSTSSPGRSMIIVRFLVGQDEEQALVRLNQKLAANASALPAGASPPFVQLRSIDDVPVMALTLWGPGYDDVRLRAMARQLQEVLKELPDVSTVTVIGGRPRQVTIDLDPAALAARRLDPIAVQQALAGSNQRAPAGTIVAANRAWRLESGRWLESVQAVKNTVVATGGGPIRLSDVAAITEGGGEPDSYVTQYPRPGEAFPAVTLSIAKRKGTNAIALTQAVERKVDSVRGYLLPSDLQASITRNYGDFFRRRRRLFYFFLGCFSFHFFPGFFITAYHICFFSRVCGTCFNNAFSFAFIVVGICLYGTSQYSLFIENFINQFLFVELLCVGDFQLLCYIQQFRNEHVVQLQYVIHKNT
jgi:multidrug efflux pump subunit AcrB